MRGWGICRAMNQTELYELINKHFNEGELRTLCFDLDIEYENLGGRGKSNNVRELILFVLRKERYDDLYVQLKHYHPNVNWSEPEETIYKQTPNTDNSPPLDSKSTNRSKSFGILIAIGLFAIAITIWLQFFDKQATINFLAGTVLTVIIIGILIISGHEFVMRSPPFPGGRIEIYESKLDQDGSSKKMLVWKASLEKRRRVIVKRPPNHLGIKKIKIRFSEYNGQNKRDKLRFEVIKKSGVNKVSHLSPQESMSVSSGRWLTWFDC